MAIHVETQTLPIKQDILLQERVSAFISQMVSTYLTHWDESQNSIFLGTIGLMKSVFAEKFTPIEKGVNPEHFKVKINETPDQIQFAEELLAIAKHKQNYPDSKIDLSIPQGVSLDSNFAGETFITVFSHPVNNDHRRQMIMQLVGNGNSPMQATTVELIP